MKLLAMFTLAGLGALAALGATIPAATAFDCSAAKTASEKAICASPQAIKADADMSAAFSALIKLLPASQKKPLVGDQGAWITERDAACTGEEDGGTATPAELTACLIRESGARQKFLAGLPTDGPGEGSTIVPVIEAGADASFIESLRFLDPQTAGEKRLNALLAKDVKPMQVAKNSDGTTDSYTATLTYASPDFVSVHVEGASLGAQYAHDMPFLYDINFDMTAGKPLTFTDAFDPAALPELQKDCIGQLKSYLSTGDDGDADSVAANKANVEDAVGNLDQWSFGASEATLNFDQQDQDPMAVCHLAYADLKTLIKPGFPLPK